ncbi:neutral/alkaline non-lysosomal ceramidase N-terminal domain-containing protein [Vulgatibacter sp.]|uniref:neutral/alkaline non-lysosomal ceramidase N-terminal domain-containing protein n=1 Tax=Vulgatibacter sp. TaxID=1971226 RepID=UPI0035613277
MNALLSLRNPARLVVLFLLGLVAAAAGLDLRAGRQEAPPRLVASAGGRGALLAGAGRAPIALPPEVVLAGYQAFGRSPKEPSTPLYARSLLLEAGGVRTAVVLVELLTLPEPLAHAVQERAAAEGAACALVVASHTHSGPGGYDQAFLPQLVLGRYDPAVERAILEAVEASLVAARAELAPATLATGEALGAGLASNRDHKGEAVDQRITRVALQRPDGKMVATLARFSAHPTLNPRKVGPAGDWPGFTMERLEEQGGVAFVLPGAVGDARPTRAASPGKGAIRALLFGETIAERVGAIPLVAQEGPVALACAEVEFDLPPADVAGMVPEGLGRLASNLAAPTAPRTARAMAFQLGDLALVGVPAEPLGATAPLFERAAAARGLRGRVVGVAQGYTSYCVSEREMERRTTSAHNAWFGEALTPRVVRAAEAATAALPVPVARDATQAAAP